MIYITILLFAYLVYKCWKRRKDAIEARQTLIGKDFKLREHGEFWHIECGQKTYKSLEEAKEKYYEHITEAGREGK
tara:strand:- start:857 stop:1084 length:228 start_codon:yes stop_codon:yes gene_type:complete